MRIEHSEKIRPLARTSLSAESLKDSMAVLVNGDAVAFIGEYEFGCGLWWWWRAKKVLNHIVNTGVQLGEFGLIYTFQLGERMNDGYLWGCFILLQILVVRLWR